jgi:stress response protein YsnF
MNEEQNLVIPLVEERVSATKREVETGRVRVRTRVEERQELVRAELARDEVDVERVAIGREVQDCRKSARKAPPRSCRSSRKCSSSKRS